MNGLMDTSDNITNNCTIIVVQDIYGEKSLYLSNKRNQKDGLFQTWSMEAYVP